MTQNQRYDLHHACDFYHTTDVDQRCDQKPNFILQGVTVIRASYKRLTSVIQLYKVSYGRHTGVIRASHARHTIQKARSGNSRWAPISGQRVRPFLALCLNETQSGYKCHPAGPLYTEVT